MNKYTCEKHRPVYAENKQEAAEIIAKRKARDAYGCRGYARSCTLESWSRDGIIGEFNAFVGYKSALNETSGHNVRFTIIRRRA